MEPEEVQQIIDMLVERLGPLGEHVWAVYVRQVYVDVLIESIWGVLSLLLLAGGCAGLVYCVRRYRRVKAENRQRYSDVGEWECIGVIACSCVAAAAAMLCAVAFSSWAKLLNPDFHAIQMLLGR